MNFLKEFLEQHITHVIYIYIYIYIYIVTYSESVTYVKIKWKNLTSHMYKELQFKHRMVIP